MTDSTIPRRPLPAAIVLAGLVLAGCSGTNVGSSWQCPLAQGGTCDSVAGADPAVAQTAPADGMTIRERSTGRAAARGPSRRHGPARRTATAASIRSAGWCGCSRRVTARTIHGRPMPGR